MRANEIQIIPQIGIFGFHLKGHRHEMRKSDRKLNNKMDYIMRQKLVLVGLVVIIVAAIAFPTHGKEVSFNRKLDLNVKQEESDVHHGLRSGDGSGPPAPKHNGRITPEGAPT
jgi:hypothetical protein